MALEPLTPEERRAALGKAVEARGTRSRAKAALQSGELTVEELLAQADHDEALARLRVTEMLESLRGIGPVRARAILATLGIAPSRRLRGLGVHQRRALVDFLAG
ncbi:integration host factor, actinobacterial type [Sinomonas sp. RB5]